LSLQETVEESTQRPSARHILQLAIKAHLAGRHTEAIDGYLYVLAEDRKHVDALHLLAIVLHQTGKSTEALALARRAVTLRQNASTCCALGVIARETRHYVEAEDAYRKAIELAPDKADIHSNLALVLSDTSRFAEAEAAYRRALEIKPDFAEAHNNLGVLLKKTGRLDDAVAAYHQALAANSDYAEAHNNVGVIYKDYDRLAEAEVAYRRAIELKPDYADACWNLGLVLLALGRYREAWPYYESRYHSKRTEAVSLKPNLPCPQWHGESIAGKSLIIWTEQGFGDYVQFARYIPLLKQRGAAYLTVACAPPLKPLLGTLAGVDTVVTSHKNVPTHDYWVFPLSLPSLFDSSLENLPATLPYVHALPERVAQWQPRLATNARKVGLVWKGNPGHANDSNRSLAHLSLLAPLWAVPEIRFFSLQKGSGEDEVDDLPPTQPIIALGRDIVDFADTAAIISMLDLVICVDTVVAHIAGAMGKPCWVLLPHTGCDWRWLLETDESPWYPRVMRLFRQTRPDNWAAVVGEVAAALERWRELECHV